MNTEDQNDQESKKLKIKRKEALLDERIKELLNEVEDTQTQIDLNQG